MDDTDAEKHPAVQQPSQSDQSTPQAAEPTANTVTDRTDLLEKARAFLTSPQVRYEDNAAKRRFLAEKGLNGAEIDGLLQELVSVYSMSRTLYS